MLGSLVAGPALGWLAQRLFEQVQHIPTAIILQFVGRSACGWWRSTWACRACSRGRFATTLARMCRHGLRRACASHQRGAATVVFALNIFAFIFIGLQIRPILVELAPPAREQYLGVAAAVLATVILVRIVWHMSFNAALRSRDRHFGFNPPRPMLRPSVGSGLVISWAGMRGIVTLAAASALPEGFPARDLIVLGVSSWCWAPC